MRTLRLLLASTVAALATLTSITPSASAARVACGKDDLNKILWCEVADLGTPADGGGNVSVDLEYVPYRWDRENQGPEWVRQDGVFINCEPLPGPPDAAGIPTLRYGDVWVITMTHKETGEVVATQYRCVYPGEDPPAPPPAPPTPGTVLQSLAPLLVLEPAHDPRVRGLTGLDTHLWCTGGSQVSTAPISLSGWTAQATAIRTGVAWDIIGPETLHLAGVGGCGSPEAPSAVWMPNSIGSYQIAVTGTWTIAYTASYTGLGFNLSLTIPVGSLTISTDPVPFDVIESPGVLVSG